MITDAQLLLESSRAITAATTYVSTNTIDLGVARDVGASDKLFVFHNVEVAGADGTSVRFELITSAAANLGSPTVIAVSPTVLLAALTLNAAFAQKVPHLINGVGQRYLGSQIVSVGTFTALTISSRMVLGFSDVKYYASGFTIL